MQNQSDIANSIIEEAGVYFEQKFGSEKFVIKRGLGSGQRNQPAIHFFGKMSSAWLSLHVRKEETDEGITLYVMYGIHDRQSAREDEKSFHNSLASFRDDISAFIKSAIDSFKPFMTLHYITMTADHNVARFYAQRAIEDDITDEFQQPVDTIGLIFGNDEIDALENFLDSCPRSEASRILIQNSIADAKARAKTQAAT